MENDELTLDRVVGLHLSETKEELKGTEKN